MGVDDDADETFLTLLVAMNDKYTRGGEARLRGFLMETANDRSKENMAPALPPKTVGGGGKSGGRRKQIVSRGGKRRNGSRGVQRNGSGVPLGQDGSDQKDGGRHIGRDSVRGGGEQERGYGGSRGGGGEGGGDGGYRCDREIIRRLGKRDSGKAGIRLESYVTVTLHDCMLEAKRRRHCAAGAEGVPEVSSCNGTGLAEVHSDPQQDEEVGQDGQGGGGGGGDSERRLEDNGGDAGGGSGGGDNGGGRQGDKGKSTARVSSANAFCASLNTRADELPQDHNIGVVTLESNTERISTLFDFKTNSVVNPTNTTEEIYNSSISELDSLFSRPNIINRNKGSFGQGSSAPADVIHNSAPLISEWSLADRKLVLGVIHCLVKDNLPLSTVEKPGFQEMLKEFNPSYEPHDIDFYFKTVLPKVYLEQFTNCCKMLHTHCTGLFAMSARTLKSDSKAHVYFMVHFIDVNWKMHKYWLYMYPCPLRSLGQDTMNAALQHVLRHWSLDVKNMVAFTTDCLSNTLNICISDDSYFVPCVNWCLNMAIHKVLQDTFLQNLVQATRQVLAINIQDLLMALVQDGLERGGHNSRCIKTLELLRQMYEIYTIPSDFHNSKNMSLFSSLTLKELESVELVVFVLQKLHGFVEELAHDPNMLTSALKPLLQRVFDILNEQRGDTAVKTCFKSKVWKLINSVYADQTTTSKFQSLCTILDPRFHSTPMTVTAEVRQLAMKELKRVVSTLGDERPEATPSGFTSATGRSTASDTDPSELDPLPTHPRAGGLSSISTAESGNGCSLTLEKKMIMEFDIYLEQPQENKNICPLMWWRSAEQRFPTLALLARACLCVPAIASSSVTALPLFDKVTNSDGNSSQNQICQQLLNQIVLLSKNLDLVRPKAI